MLCRYLVPHLNGGFAQSWVTRMVRRREAGTRMFTHTRTHTHSTHLHTQARTHTHNWADGLRLSQSADLEPGWLTPGKHAVQRPHAPFGAAPPPPASVSPEALGIPCITPSPTRCSLRTPELPWTSVPWTTDSTEVGGSPSGPSRPHSSSQKCPWVSDPVHPLICLDLFLGFK